MTVASPESVELEEQRAELNAVLESKEFTRAPTLAHLLSYLCEKLFAGEAGQIKEYSVGVEVFRLSRFRKFGQRDKWKGCSPTAIKMAEMRSNDDATSTPEPHIDL